MTKNDGPLVEFQKGSRSGSVALIDTKKAALLAHVMRLPEVKELIDAAISVATEGEYWHYELEEALDGFGIKIRL